MCKKGLVWFLVVAFLSFVLSPDSAGAETAPSTPEGPTAGEPEAPSPLSGLMDVEPGPFLPENDVCLVDITKEGFCVPEPIQLARAQGVQEEGGKESTGTQTEGREEADREAPKKEGLSTAAKIALVVVAVVLVALLVAAASAGGGFGGLSGLNLNFGK